MVSIMSEIIKDLKLILNKKGQGLVEFGLVCAFCAALGIFIRGVGFSEAFNVALDKSTPELYSAAIASRPRNNYMDYFHLWSTKSVDSIKSATKSDGSSYTNDDRIEADQKALVKIAETYLGKTENQVFGLMETFANTLNDNAPDYVNNLKCNQTNGTGFSKGVLVPLSYKSNTLENNVDNPDDENRKSGWLWLEQNNNQNTVAYLTNNEGKTYDKYDDNNPTATKPNDRQTATTDRIFYSDDLLDNNEARITLRLHYTNGKVDFVDVALRVDNTYKNDKNQTVYPISNNSTMADGLCLHVTQSGHSVIDNTGTAGGNDIINNPGKYYNTNGTLKP